MIKSYVMNVTIRLLVLFALGYYCFGTITNFQGEVVSIPADNNPAPVVGLLLWYGYELVRFVLGSIKNKLLT